MPRVAVLAARALCVSLLWSTVAAGIIPLTALASDPPVPRRFPVQGRPIVEPGSRGSMLTVSSGAYASLGARRPTLRAADGFRFATLVLHGDLVADGRTYGFTVQVFFSAEEGTDWKETDFFFGVARGRGSRSGTNFAFESHAYHSLVPDTSFRYRSDLSRARFDTGTVLGAWGGVDMRFRADGPVHRSCGGRTRSRLGEARGMMSFTPRHDNGAFGTIARARFTDAELITSNCDHGFSGGGEGELPPCPSPSVMTGGYAFDDRRYRGFFASTDGFTDGTGFESVIAQEFWPRMSVAHEVFAVVPDAWITEDTESVSFRGAGNVFLQGSATVTATEAAFVDGPYPCGEGEVSFRVQEGSFVGSAGRPLTADFVTGPLSAPVTPDAWYGYIVRTVVAS